MIRQRNQDAGQDGAMPLLAASIIWHLGAVLVSLAAGVVGRNFGNK